MTEWVPTLTPIPGPRYLAFVQSLETDIAAGRIKPGMRLLPQREMAQRLGLSVGTISKAYTEAEQRGLISGEVGRGTFVQRRKAEQRTALGTSEATVNLALNVPPYTGEDDVIASVLAEIVADGEMPNLLGYLPHQGLRQHREAMVVWLASLGVTATADQLFITHGGQHALSIAIGMLAQSGDTVLTESYTYYLAAAARRPHPHRAGDPGRAGRHHAGAAGRAATDGTRKPRCPAMSRRARERGGSRARPGRNSMHSRDGRSDLVRLKHGSKVIFISR
jgi:DNA-binding transcriptional MocR family regulator